jgi:glycerol uptake facilitator-like aquaporin
MVWIFGEASGAYLNPAVLCGSLLIGRLDKITFLAFFIIELVAGVLAELTLVSLVPSNIKNYDTIGVTVLHNDLNVIQGIGFEVIVTFILMFTAMASSDKRRAGSGGISQLFVGISVAIAVYLAVRLNFILCFFILICKHSIKGGTDWSFT